MKNKTNNYRNAFDKKFPQTKEAKSFFDYSLKEKKEIVDYAAKESNRMQRETVDATIATEEWDKEFDKEFRYLDEGIWRKKMEGYEDENGRFIKKPHEAYAVPDFFKSFIRSLLSQQREEIRRKTIKEIEKILRDHLSGKKTDNLDIYNTIGEIQKDINALKEK